MRDVQKEKVLILGAGYASLSLIRSLPDTFLRGYEVVLISKTDYHYSSVLLHEVASGAINDSAKFYLKDILPDGVAFINDCVVEIKHKEVICEGGNYNYDFLVVGLGFMSDDFGIPGVREHALSISDFDSALNIFAKLKTTLKDFTPTLSLLKPRVVICGAGFTGIELLGSLLDHKEGLYSGEVEFICIEASPKLLGMYPDDLTKKAKDYLENKGAKLLLGSKILGCESGAIIIEKDGQKEKIPTSLIIWTAGVRGNDVIAKSSFFTSARSRVEVDYTLRPINQDNQELMQNIFVIGDCSAVKDPQTQRFYPPTAQISIAQGEYLARHLPKFVLNSMRFVVSFEYKSAGSVCSIGDKYAIGVIGNNKSISGFFAIKLKRFIEKKWVIKLLGLKGLFS